MIRMEGISARYPEDDAAILSDFSLRIAPGECVLLTGPSGCGKTTVTRLANGLLKEFYGCELQGKFTLAGRDAFKLGLNDFSRLAGSVFQAPRSQFFTLQVAAEIAFPAENAALPEGEIRKRVLAASGLAGVRHILNQDLSRLSSGQKQAVAVASAAVLFPKALILDEPSANLDPLATRNLHDLLVKLKAQGASILIVEHKHYWLRDLCDRAIIGDNGKVKQELSGREYFGLSTEASLALVLRHTRPQMPEAAGRPAPVEQTGVPVSGLSFGYAKKDLLLSDIELLLPKNSLTGLIGENGAGKSTLARLLMGLEKTAKGIIEFGGQRLLPKDRLKKSFYVMQDADYQLVTESVISEIPIGQTQADAMPKALKILAPLGLSGLEERHPSTLSGGQKQRLTLALAVMSDAELIIFDEPTSGLDGRNMRKVTAMLRELAASGKVVLVISHDGEFLTEACDRLLQLKNGKVTEIELCKNNHALLQNTLW